MAFVVAEHDGLNSFGQGGAALQSGQTVSVQGIADHSPAAVAVPDQPLHDPLRRHDPVRETAPHPDTLVHAHGRRLEYLLGSTGLAHFQADHGTHAGEAVGILQAAVGLLKVQAHAHELLIGFLQRRQKKTDLIAIEVEGFGPFLEGRRESRQDRLHFLLAQAEHFLKPDLTLLFPGHGPGRIHERGMGQNVGQGHDGHEA